MDFRPVPGQTSPNFGSVAALCACQLGVSIVMAVVLLFLANVGGAGVVAPLAGAMGYASWAEYKAPGCLTPRLTRLLAFWSAVVAVVVALPFLYTMSQDFSNGGAAPLPSAAWAVVIVVGGVLSFLVTWSGLALGRRTAERARRAKSGA